MRNFAIYFSIQIANPIAFYNDVLLRLLYNAPMQPIPLPVVVLGDNGLQDAITKAGSKSALARMLGITRAAVSHWTKLPGGRLYQLKVIRPEWFAKTREKV